MTSSGNFKFTALPKKICPSLANKNILEFLMKWSMKGNFKVFYYNFNEQFYSHLKQEFVDSFFCDPEVYSTLETIKCKSWCPIGIPANHVEFVDVPCTITSMAFFSRLQDPDNNIVRNGYVLQAMEEQIDGFYVSDHLRFMLLDETHDTFNLYSKPEREQFIFLLFKHLCLGGTWCQHEELLKPYLDVTKDIYKSLLSVERFEKQTGIFVRSIVLKVTAYAAKNEPICPQNPHQPQNFMYLIIDPFKRQVAALVHQLSDSLFT